MENINLNKLSLGELFRMSIECIKENMSALISVYLIRLACLAVSFWALIIPMIVKISNFAYSNRYFYYSPSLNEKQALMILSLLGSVFTFILLFIAINAIVSALTDCMVFTCCDLYAKGKVKSLTELFNYSLSRFWGVVGTSALMSLVWIGIYIAFTIAVFLLLFMFEAETAVIIPLLAVIIGSIYLAFSMAFSKKAVCKYKNGGMNAIIYSFKTTRGNFLSIIALFAVYIAVSLVVQGSVANIAGNGLGVLSITYLISIIFTQLLYFIFQCCFNFLFINCDNLNKNQFGAAFPDLINSFFGIIEEPIESAPAPYSEN